MPAAGRYADPNAMGHALIDGAADAGIRLTLLDTCYLSSGARRRAAGEDRNSGSATARRRGGPSGSRRYQQTPPTPGVLVGAALHSVRGVPVDEMAAVVEWATRHDAPLHVHSSEQTAEVDQCLAVHGRTPTALLRDAGALGPRTTAVHATHLTERGHRRPRRTATGVCFCPTTERDLGDGVGPAPALLDGRGPFSLGSDSHAVIDLFEEARAVELDERLAPRERGIIAAATLLTPPPRRPTRTRLAGRRRARGRGARRLRRRRPGSVRTAGGGATVENAVFAAAAADVTDVVVDGRAVVADRRHVPCRTSVSNRVRRSAI